MWGHGKGKFGDGDADDDGVCGYKSTKLANFSFEKLAIASSL